MTKDTSGPAFPVTDPCHDKGLTIRQYAAIKAMQGLLAECGGADVQYVAMRAVKAADALLAELEK